MASSRVAVALCVVASACVGRRDVGPTSTGAHVAAPTTSASSTAASDAGAKHLGSKVFLEPSGAPVFSKIYFDAGRVTASPQEMGLVEDDARIVKARKDYVVLVEGHADDPTTDQGNLELSTKRAEVVVEAMVVAGVPRAQLRAKGFGAYCPEDMGNTPLAHTKNRRVQFRVIATADGLTGVPTGCPAASTNGVSFNP